jgi:4-alpha-glucanotransferase
MSNRPVTDAWGIDSGYEDASRQWHDTPAETRSAILAAMGSDESHGPDAGRVLVLRRGELIDLGAGELSLEDGTSVSIRGRPPADVPLGYHRFQPADGGHDTLLIVSPGQCVPPLQDRRQWGWAAQLYAVRSQQSWGIGDLADLQDLAEWAGRLGSGMLLINPLLAVAPNVPQESSPYYPISRCFLNPLYLRVEDVPGAQLLGEQLGRLAAAGRCLNDQRQIDRDAVFRLKQEALAAIWDRTAAEPAFERFRTEQGRPLECFAQYCALAERHGRNWRAWPRQFQRPQNAAVRKFADEHARRVLFHQWLQWQLDQQLARAATALPIVQDLPIGFDPDGADAWAWQDQLANGCSVGAPPDAYNSQGQDWGLPPFVPHKLRAAGYAPLIQTIRAAMRHARGLRIDHVMGLFRLFWIPRGLGARHGTYVRYRPDESLAIVAVESVRAGAFVVGEDLGTVEPGVREQLAAHRILSYRVLWFEDDPPARYPELSMVAATTHDLPTIAGLWTGSDLAAQQQIGMEPSLETVREMRDRLKKATSLPDNAPVEQVIETTYRALAESPARIVTATLEDALQVEERPNMPATTHERPNWSLALPGGLEALDSSPLARRIAAVLNQREPAVTGTHAAHQPHIGSTPTRDRV